MLFIKIIKNQKNSSKKDFISERSIQVSQQLLLEENRLRKNKEKKIEKYYHLQNCCLSKIDY